MDDLLSEFLTETHESLDVVDVELVKFEQEPNNAEILGNIFRLVHTIKGTCGFLGLPRLEALAHAAESLMGKYRDGSPVTGEGVTMILLTIDRIKELLDQLGATGAEPEGADPDLIDKLDVLTAGGSLDGDAAPSDSVPSAANDDAGEKSGDDDALSLQILERELKPGEVSLDDLERAFREAPGPEMALAEPEMPAPAAPAPANEEPAQATTKAPAKAKDSKAPAAAKPAGKTEAPVQNQTLRVNVETLEQLITTVSELVLTRNQLLEIVRHHEDSEFKVPLQRLSNVTAELQEGVMQTRMQPIGNAWQKLPRIVRDLAQELDKDIELEMVGQDTELDRQVLELIKDPLTHMVRNSADHGLEMPDEREASGKPRKGLVRLSAYHEGGHIIISIADDGKGLNSDKIREKVLDKGLATEAELDKMSEAQIHRFIMGAGFSTAQQVTAVSGRGVGMDVVRTNIELIGGSIDLKSVEGEGTTFTIKIPLTLAIVSALIVESAGERFAIPQLAVMELVRAQSNSDHRIEHIKDTPVLRLRNQLLPLVSLQSVLGIEPRASAEPLALAEPDVAPQPIEVAGVNGEAVDAVLEEDHGAQHGDLTTRTGDAETGFIVVMQVGGQIFGIVVDGVFHTEEIVVKPMSSLLRNIPTFSGNTILGDGSVIMIIDPNGVAQAIRTDIAEQTEKSTDAAGEDSQARETTSMLIFTAGSEEPKAVPLSLVTRLEEIPVERIEASNGKHVVQYRGQLMPLIRVNEDVAWRQEGTQPLLVFSDSGRSMGLVIDRIVDIVEEDLGVELSSEREGIVGTAVIKGQATEILDVGHYLPMAFSDWFRRRDIDTNQFNQTLVLVDDSPFFRNMLTPVLKSAGYNVRVFNHGREAWEALSQGLSCDLVVSDIEMPEMNGFELCERLSADPKLSSIPLIALSSHTSPAAIERGRQAGFCDFVAKFDRKGLLASLHDIRNGRQAA
jgi:two-component system chemotaxis sensor kinase CheA